MQGVRYVLEGVVSEQKETFPLRKVEDHIMRNFPNTKQIIFMNIVKIDKEDYEYKYAELCQSTATGRRTN